jgi:hypothetical protein
MTALTFEFCIVVIEDIVGQAFEFVGNDPVGHCTGVFPDCREEGKRVTDCLLSERMRARILVMQSRKETFCVIL